jgi:hypothetical protein
MKKNIKIKKISGPLSQADKASLETKSVTENAGPQHWHGRSKLRTEARTDGPLNQPNTGGSLYKTQDADGRWSTDGALKELQPLAGPGHSVSKQELGVMPDQVPQPQGEALRSVRTDEETLTVRSKQHDFDARVDIFNRA